MKIDSMAVVFMLLISIAESASKKFYCVLEIK